MIPRGRDALALRINERVFYGRLMLAVAAIGMFASGPASANLGLKPDGASRRVPSGGPACGFGRAWHSAPGRDGPPADQSRGIAGIMRQNQALARQRAGKITFGPGVVYDSADLAEQIAHMGFDWVWLDWQHGQFTELMRSASPRA